MSNVNKQIKRSFLTSCLFTIAVFAVSVAVCEISMYELPNILNLNLWSWKWRSWMLTIWMKTDRQTYFSTCMSYLQKLVPLGPAVCSQYISWLTNGCSDIHTCLLMGLPHSTPLERCKIILRIWEVPYTQLKFGIPLNLVIFCTLLNRLMAK